MDSFASWWCLNRCSVFLRLVCRCFSRTGWWGAWRFTAQHVWAFLKACYFLFLGKQDLSSPSVQNAAVCWNEWSFLGTQCNRHSEARRAKNTKKPTCNQENTLVAVTYTNPWRHTVISKLCKQRVSRKMKKDSEQKATYLTLHTSCPPLWMNVSPHHCWTDTFWQMSVMLSLLCFIIPIQNQLCFFHYIVPSFANLSLPLFVSAAVSGQSVITAMGVLSSWLYCMSSSLLLNAFCR